MRKVYYKIKLPIEFINLKTNAGWYYQKKYKKDKRGPLIEINAKLGMFDKINTMYHELTHMVMDYLQEISWVKIQDKVAKNPNLKVVNTEELNTKKEEYLANVVGNVVEKIYKKVLLSKEKVNAKRTRVS